MPKKMFLLACINEDIRFAGTPALYPSMPAAEVARDQDVENTLQMLRDEGLDDDAIRYEGGCSPVIRYGDDCLYTWEITEIEIPE